MFIRVSIVSRAHGGCVTRSKKYLFNEVIRHASDMSSHLKIDLTAYLCQNTMPICFAWLAGK